MRGQPAGADGLSGRVGRRRKPAHKAHQQNASGAGRAGPCQAGGRAQEAAQHFPAAAAHQQSGHDQEREQGQKQRPSAKGQPLPQGLGAGRRRGKGQRRRQQRDQNENTAAIHKQPPCFHIYGQKRRTMPAASRARRTADGRGKRCRNNANAG